MNIHQIIRIRYDGLECRDNPSNHQDTLRWIGVPGQSIKSSGYALMDWSAGPISLNDD